MYSMTERKFTSARKALIKEIIKRAIKVKNKNYLSELRNTITLNFSNEIYNLSPGLENYPFLFVGKNKIAFVYVDKKYHNEYISAYKTGKIALKTDSLEMFTADELYNTCIELEKIENEFEIRKKQYP